jgi:hypothetical protein
MQNYANQQSFADTKAANIMNLVRSTPTTQQQTTYQAPPNAVSQLGGLGATALGAYGASGGFKSAKEGGVIKMASGGIASGVPAEKLPSMLKKLSDAQLADKANLETNDPQTAAEAISQQSFRANARENVPTGYAPGGIVAFANGGDPRDADAQPGGFYGSQTQPSQNDLATRAAEYKGLLGDRGDVGAKYMEALKNAQPDKGEQLWGRLMQFGANMAAGTSPNALTNIGAAAQQTVPGIIEDTRERRKAQGEMAKAQYDVSNMEYGDQVKLLTLAQTDRNAFAKIAADMGMKEKELANALQMNINTNKQSGINANIAAGATIKAAGIRSSMGGGGVDKSLNTQFNSVFGNIANGMQKTNPVTGVKIPLTPEEIKAVTKATLDTMNQSQIALGRKPLTLQDIQNEGGGSNTSSTGNKVGTYNEKTGKVEYN